MSAVTVDRVQVYVGYESPEEAKVREGLTALGDPSSVPERHPLSRLEFEWGTTEPRWDGENTSLCAAALVPSLHYDTFLPEGLARYRTAAYGRDELALVICEVGQYRGPLNVVIPPDIWTALPDPGRHIRGQRLPAGITLELGDGLSRADRDLALRLRDNRRDGPWYSLRREADGSPPLGPFRPLLMTDIGETVAAVWTDENETASWYLLPCGLPWETIVSWLETQALPDTVPGAMVRARRSVAEDLVTIRERETLARLMEFERKAERELAKLTREVQEAREWGDRKRYSLLYGSGKQLVKAVTAILGEAGFTVENLDQTFGSGRSGDLLVSMGQRHWLVEVTSSSGAIAEIEVGKILAHLETWPRLRAESLRGAVLIVNHDYRRSPSERPRGPYRRSEFVEALKVRVVGTVPLCRAWAHSDMGPIVEAITGPPGQVLT